MFPFLFILFVCFHFWKRPSLGTICEFLTARDPPVRVKQPAIAFLSIMLQSFLSLLLTLASAAALHGSSAVLHAPSPALHASLAAAHAPHSQQHAGRMSKLAMCMSRRSSNSLLAGVLSAGVFNVPLPSKAAEAVKASTKGVYTLSQLEKKMKDLEIARTLAQRNGNYEEAVEDEEEEEVVNKERKNLETEEAEEQMAVIFID